VEMEVCLGMFDEFVLVVVQKLLLSQFVQTL